MTPPSSLKPQASSLIMKLPADAPVLSGCLALLAYLAAQRRSLNAARLLLHLSAHGSMDGPLICDRLQLSHADAELVVLSLQRRGLVEADDGSCALTPAGEVEIMAMLGSVMLAGDHLPTEPHPMLHG